MCDIFHFSVKQKSGEKEIFMCFQTLQQIACEICGLASCASMDIRLDIEGQAGQVARLLKVFCYLPSVCMEHAVLAGKDFCKYDGLFTKSIKI